MSETNEQPSGSPLTSCVIEQIWDDGRKSAIDVERIPGANFATVNENGEAIFIRQDVWPILRAKLDEFFTTTEGGTTMSDERNGFALGRQEGVLGRGFNINNCVEVKLTERGREIHRKNHDDLFFGMENPPQYTPPEEDKNGWSKWQMWALMQAFGSSIGVTAEPPFETTIRIHHQANIGKN